MRSHRLTAGSKVACVVLCCTALVGLFTAAFCDEFSPIGGEGHIYPEARPERTLCGIRSISILLREYGIDRSCEEILDEIPPGIYGNSMGQLVTFLQRDGRLIVTPLKISADELYNRLEGKHGRAALINLSDHWVFVRMARERAFEVVDFPKKYYMPVDAADDYWDGHSILVEKRGLLQTNRWACAALLCGAFIGAAVVLRRALKRAGSRTD